MSKRIGSRFADFLVEEGIKDDVDLLTVKKVLADEIRARMAKKKMGVQQLATRMKTSRDVAYRLLDAKSTGVTLRTISKAAVALESSLVDLLIAVEQNARKTHSKQRR